MSTYISTHRVVSVIASRDYQKDGGTHVLMIQATNEAGELCELTIFSDRELSLDVPALEPEPGT